MKLKATLLIGSLYFFSPVAIATTDFMPGKIIEHGRSGGRDSIEETTSNPRTVYPFTFAIAGNVRVSVASDTYSQMRRYILGRQRSGEPYVCTKVRDGYTRIFRTQRGNNTPLTVKHPWQCLQINVSNNAPYIPVTLSSSGADGATATFANPFNRRQTGTKQFSRYRLSGYPETFEATQSGTQRRGPNWNASIRIYEEMWKPMNIKNLPYACARIKGKNVNFVSQGTASGGNLNNPSSKVIFVTKNPYDCFRY